jgi:hypothetical protein
LRGLSVKKLVEGRYAKFRQMSRFTE